MAKIKFFMLKMPSFSVFMVANLDTHYPCYSYRQVMYNFLFCQHKVIQFLTRLQLSYAIKKSKKLAEYAGLLRLGYFFSFSGHKNMIAPFISRLAAGRSSMEEGH
jgi:hypothetical protein